MRDSLSILTCIHSLTHTFAPTTNDTHTRIHWMNKRIDSIKNKTEWRKAIYLLLIRLFRMPHNTYWSQASRLHSSNSIFQCFAECETCNRHRSIDRKWNIKNEIIVQNAVWSNLARAQYARLLAQLLACLLTRLFSIVTYFFFSQLLVNKSIELNQ